MGKLTHILTGIVALTALVIGYRLLQAESSDQPLDTTLYSNAKLSNEPALPPPKTVAPERKLEISQILVELDHLEQSDQKGLDALLDKGRRVIEASPDAFAKDLAASFAHLNEIPLERSFFLMKSHTRYHPDPAHIVVRLLRMQTHEREKTTDDTIHHVDIEDRLGLLKTYALEQLNQRYKNVPPPDSVVETLLAAVQETARSEPNLAIVREAIRWTIRLSGKDSATVREIVESRPQSERFAFADLISDL